MAGTVTTSSARSRRASLVAPIGWPWKTRLVLLSAIWGSSFLFIKVGDRSFDPFEVAAARTSVGALTLVVVLMATKDRLPSNWRLWAHLAVAGLFMNTLPFTLFAWGEQRVSAVTAGIFNATTPLFVLPVAFVMLPSERLTRSKAVGLGIGFLGVLVVLGAWNGVGGIHLTGDVAFLVAAASYGFGIPYTRRFITGSSGSATSLAAGQLLAASAELAIVSPLFARAPSHVYALSVLSLLALGAFCTGVAYILNYSIVREAGATNASLVTYLITVFSTILGVAVLGEGLSWSEPVGAVVVFFGVALTQGRALALRRDRRAARLGAAARREVSWRVEDAPADG